MNQVLKLSWQIANSDRQNGLEHNDNNSNTITTRYERTRLQAKADFAEDDERDEESLRR